MAKPAGPWRGGPTAGRSGSGRPRRGRRRGGRGSGSGGAAVLWWLGGAAAGLGLLVAGVVVWAIYRPVGSLPAALGPAGPAARASGAASGAPAAGGASRAVLAQAAADAATAQAALAETQAATARAGAALATAQAAGTRLAALAAPTLARNPSATDPSTEEGNLRRDAADVDAALLTADQAAAGAATAARSAAALPGTQAAVASARSEAGVAAARAATAVARVAGARAAAAALVSQAVAAVHAWQAVHAAPAGSLGATLAAVPADWTVRGCEVVTAAPGGAAWRAGLIGRTQRTDPVGDVITALTDATDAGARWSVPDCAALHAAMARTRVGDTLTIAYEHRHVPWYLLGASWVPRSGSATLASGPTATCPAPLTGTITPGAAGRRIALRVNVSGPNGTRAGVPVMLDTGGVDTTFPDAFLRGLGYHPSSRATGISGIVPGASGTAYLYRLPGSALTVSDGGRSVPVATGTLTVWGIVHGTDYALGPDILQHGAHLSVVRGGWSLTPPCA